MSCIMMEAVLITVLTTSQLLDVDLKLLSVISMTNIMRLLSLSVIQVFIYKTLYSTHNAWLYFQPSESMKVATSHILGAKKLINYATWDYERLLTQVFCDLVDFQLINHGKSLLVDQWFVNLLLHVCTYSYLDIFTARTWLFANDSSFRKIILFTPSESVHPVTKT